MRATPPTASELVDENQQRRRYRVETAYIDRARVLKLIGRNRRNRDRHIRNRLRPLGRRDDNRVHGVIARIVGACRRCGRERRLLILSLRWTYGPEGGTAAEPARFPHQDQTSEVEGRKE